MAAKRRSPGGKSRHGLTWTTRREGERARQARGACPLPWDRACPCVDPVLTRASTAAAAKTASSASLPAGCSSWATYDEVEASGELCQAAKDSNLSMLQLLLDCDCSANAADYDQRTCLHLAACEGNLHIVQLLLE